VSDFAVSLLVISICTFVLNWIIQQGETKSKKIEKNLRMKEY